MSAPFLASILEFTRDGEWGKGEPGPGLVEMGVIRGTDFAKVRRGDLSTVPIRYIPEKAAMRKMLQPNDILLETAGGTKDQPTGRSVFIPGRVISGSPRPLTCASFARFLRADATQVDPHYLYWYLQYLWNERLIYQYHIQHTGVARFQYTQFASEQKVPAPAATAQRDIAATLGALDDKIELNRKTAATLEEMARALYRSWFVDFDPVHARAEGSAPAHMEAATAALFPDDLGADGLPAGWRSGLLADLIDFNPKERLPKGSIAPYFDMKTLPTSGMTTESPIQREFSSGTKFRSMDTLLARITPCLENGKTGMIEGIDAGVVAWGSTEFIVMRAKEGFASALPYCVARDPSFRDAAIATMTGSSGRQRADAMR